MSDNRSNACTTPCFCSKTNACRKIIRRSRKKLQLNSTQTTGAGPQPQANQETRTGEDGDSLYTSQARAAAAVAAAAAGSHLSLWALPSYRHAACMVIGYTSTRMSTAAKPRSNPEKYVVILKKSGFQAPPSGPAPWRSCTTSRHGRSATASCYITYTISYRRKAVRAHCRFLFQGFASSCRAKG